jgi:hypothetical protein
MEIIFCIDIGAVKVSIPSAINYGQVSAAELQQRREMIPEAE